MTFMGRADHEAESDLAIRRERLFEIHVSMRYAGLEAAADQGAGSCFSNSTMI